MNTYELKDVTENMYLENRFWDNNKYFCQGYTIKILANNLKQMFKEESSIKK